MWIEQLESRFLMFGADSLSFVSTAVPHANDDVYAMVEDGALSVGNPGVTVNDTNFLVNSPNMQVRLVSAPTHGTLQDFDATLGSFEYRPDLDFHGTDTFTYRLDDGVNQSDIATVTITVAAMNDAPTLQRKTPDQLAWVGQAFELSLPHSNFFDPDGDVLAFQITREDGSGLPKWLSYDAQHQKLHGMPLYSDIGVILIRQSAADPNQASVDEIFHLAVAAVPGIAPKVASVTLNAGQSQRSKLNHVSIAFDSPVYVAPDAIVIERLSGSAASTVEGTVTQIHQNVSIAHDKTVVSLSFMQSNDSSLLAPDGTGSLKDGRYQLRIDDAKVVSLNTYQNLDGDGDGLAGGDWIFGNVVTDKFFRLYGDSDGDADVDQSDHNQMNIALQLNNNLPADLLALDKDGDGDVDLLDFDHFYKNLNTKI